MGAIRSQRYSLQIASTAFLALVMGLARSPALASSRVSFTPGISIATTVAKSDGQTPVTYATPKGLAYWTPDLPVSRGSRMNLTVFVTTGGGELKKIVVRLDNAAIATLVSAPWVTTIDTTALKSGYHMVEVWAQETGSPARSNTKTMTFYVSDDSPPQAAATNAADIPPSSMQSVSDANDSASPPSFLSGVAEDTSAAVAIHCSDADIDRQIAAGNSPVTLSSPSTFSFALPPGGTAVKFAYRLVRDGQTIAVASSPLSLRYDRVRIQGRTDQQPGLRPGSVTLWIWGIDKAGLVSPSQHVDLVIADPGSN